MCTLIKDIKTSKDIIDKWVIIVILNFTNGKNKNSSQIWQLKRNGWNIKVDPLFDAKFGLIIISLNLVKQ